MSQSPFQKFVSKKKNSVIKEEIRQDKKKARKEKNAYFDKLKEEKYQARMAAKNTGNSKTSAQEKPGTNRLNKSSAQPIPVKNGTTNLMPLNKFLAHCGICSRRDAVTLITEGKIKINGKVAPEPGYKVMPSDEVIYNNKKVFLTKNLVYILLNKPKDYITTTDDPQGRKTVLELIKKATDERVYPIGRLDRNTSGVLLLTNDGDLTQKLSHPSYEIKKIYEAKLDKPLTRADFDKIIAGLVLEDGPIHVDSLAYADSKDKSVIGIEIHSGRNRIVRRIFEHLGYDVKGLDRVMYAGLTKKNVERSKWRYLSEKEIRLLKYLNASRNRNQPDADTKFIPEKKPAIKKSKEVNKLTDKEISAAIGESVPAEKKLVREREKKTIQPRKFKTHTEKKNFKNQQVGKK